MVTDISTPAFIALLVNLAIGWLAWLREDDFPPGSLGVITALMITGVLAGTMGFPSLQLLLWLTPGVLAVVAVVRHFMKRKAEPPN
jgi:hypothetical protein